MKDLRMLIPDDFNVSCELKVLSLHFLYLSLQSDGFILV